LALTIPTDLAYHFGDAMRWYGDSKPAAQFRDLMATKALWDAEPVRELIRWAHRRKIAVEGERFLTVMLAGFRGPGQVQRRRRARDELRRAMEAVASGAESELAYADGRDLLSLSDGRQPRWGPTGSEAAGVALVFPSFAGEPSSPAGSTPSSSPSSPGSSAVPQMPHGGWLTRLK
jgi:hypothetical protein